MSGNRESDKENAQRRPDEGRETGGGRSVDKGPGGGQVADKGPGGGQAADKRHDDGQPAAKRPAGKRRDDQGPADKRHDDGQPAAKRSAGKGPDAGPRSAGSRVFTPQELAHYDGREGRPAYVSYGGLVFDASGSHYWRGGRHQDRHDAGRDLTAAFKAAPHSTTILLRLPIIGRLARS